MGGKRPLISIFPIPNAVSIKEEFMVYGRDMVKVPALLSLQRARVPPTPVCPPRGCWCWESWSSARGGCGFGAGETLPFPWQLRARVWGLQVASRVWSGTLGEPWGCAACGGAAMAP